MAAIDHAVVLGGSVAGMLASAALARHARRVTVVERDPGSSGLVHRRGVPQDWHVHALLDRGRLAIDHLMPGVFEELEELGSLRFDAGRHMRWFHGGSWRVRTPTDFELYAQSRVLLDAVLRRRVRSLPNVRWLAGTRVLGPVAEQGRIQGVRLQGGDGEWEEPCEVLLDATGRGSRASTWLRDLGYAPPPVREVRVDLGYATRAFHRDEAWPEFPMCVVYGRRPEHTRHGLAMAVEGDRWIVTLVGYGGDFPPADSHGFEAFARSLARPEISEIVRRARPASEIHTHRVREQRWRRYDRVRLPQGFGVIGDAMCSLDPVFGQGISVAAIEAELLDQSLEAHGRFDSRRFTRGCAKIIDDAWVATSVEASRYPTSSGYRPFGVSILRRVLQRVYDRSAHDPEVYRAFLSVMHLHAPPRSLLRPSILWRLRGKGPGLRTLPRAVAEAHSSSIQLSIGMG